MSQLSKSRGSVLMVCAAVVLVLILAGCGGEEAVEAPEPGEPGTQEVSRGGTVTVAMSSDPENLNPLILPTAVARVLFDVVFNGLVRSNAQLELEADLAESWTVSEDDRTVTFRLREGVTFHDGEPLTAEDVAFTLRSMAHPDYMGGQFGHVQTILGASEYRAGEADDVEGIEVLDDHTIAITTVEPDASVLVSVSLGAIGVLPKHILGDVPPGEWQTHEFNRAPIGSGPFRFVEREADSHIVLEAFDDYYAGRPNIDRLVFRIGDTRAMMAAFMNQEVDVIQVPMDELDLIKGQPFAQVVVHDQMRFNYIGMNNLHPVFSDVRVRQAVALAVNTEAVTAAVTHGHGVPITVPYYHGSWAYPQDFEGWGYDPDRAREKLDEAGWVLDGDVRVKDGVTTEVRWNHASGDEANRIAAMVQQDVEDVGFALDVQAVDFATMTHLLMPRDSQGVGRAHTPDDYHIYTLGLSVRVDPQPIERQFHSANLSPQGHNYVSYQNARVDDLFAQARAAMDFDERQMIFHELFEILGTEVAWLPLYSGLQASAAHTKIQNFEPNALGQLHNITEWSVKDGE